MASTFQPEALTVKVEGLFPIANFSRSRHPQNSPPVREPFLKNVFYGVCATCSHTEGVLVSGLPGNKLAK
ncbi:hypothetical protein BH18ACI4_BH18ACI4_07250 [soil metagenome]